MEIQVLVEDINDNKPLCEKEEAVFEVQEDEPIGKMCFICFQLYFLSLCFYN